MGINQNPVYLIAGGRSSLTKRGPDPMLQEALQTTSRPHPSVAYIGAASGDNALFRIMITRQLRRAGAGDVKLAPLCGSRADPQKAMHIIENSDMVFMSGGDVEAGMIVLEKSGVTGFLRSQYRNGKSFLGVSAGSIMLAKSWVCWPDPENERSAKRFPCLGIAPICCDTHDEEDGWEELQALVRLMPAGSIGYGIPSGAALIAYSHGSVRAAGCEVHRFIRKGKAIIQIESLIP
jgi:peptidase E